jgi:hypothetical protein
MENSNELRLNKIHLKSFLEALTDIYNRGVDFVDIIGKPGDEQDSIGIVVKEEYFSDNEKDEEEQEDLSDEDLNQLI